MAIRARLSLKARAIQLLSQREHSRMELRRKLLRHAVAACAVREAVVDAEPRVADEADVDAGGDADVGGDEGIDPGPCLDKLLDWLEAHQYLSEERFVESRVHARQSRFGTRRITQELAQHGVSADGATVAALRDTELARAQDLWNRKFGAAPADASAYAKQVRFLLARGFASDVVRRVVGRSPPASRDTAREVEEDGDTFDER